MLLPVRFFSIYKAADLGCLLLLLLLSSQLNNCNFFEQILVQAKKL